MIDYALLRRRTPPWSTIVLSEDHAVVSAEAETASINRALHSILTYVTSTVYDYYCSSAGLGENVFVYGVLQ